MDYIHEEFLRQRRALERLMVGGAEKTETETAAEETTRVYGAYDGGETAAFVKNGAPAAAAAGGAAVGRAAADSHTVRRGGMSAAAGSMDGMTVLERVSAAVQAEKTDARAVSRAIQRDARRYDGGFSLY